MKTYDIHTIKEKRILGRTADIAPTANTIATTAATKTATATTDTTAPLALFWGGAAVEVTVKSREVWATFSSNYDNAEPWVSVFINESFVSRFMIEKGEARTICLARGLNRETENLISIVKDTQPMSDDAHHALFVHSILLSDDGTFCPIKPRALKIEFIGDSITSGEGLAGAPSENDWIPQWFVASKTYAVLTARALNADYSILSQCGWGLCWAWDGNPNNKLPPFYESVCGVQQSAYHKTLGAHEVHRFNGGSDFVVINLGTNDNGAFFQVPWHDENGNTHIITNADGTPSERAKEEIVESTKNFLIKIRHHNPSAKIVWAWGMITLTVVPPLIQKGIDAYKAENGDTNVYTIELESMEDIEKTDGDKGSRGHPGQKTHIRAAEKLTAFLQSIR